MRTYQLTDKQWRTLARRFRRTLVDLRRRPSDAAGNGATQRAAARRIAHAYYAQLAAAYHRDMPR
jgi:hypothetical protein